jgi:hypothetical protein
MDKDEKQDIGEAAFKRVPNDTDPVCPHCGDDPLLIRQSRIQFPDGLVVCLIMCANVECRKVLTVAPLAMQKPEGRIIH